MTPLVCLVVGRSRALGTPLAGTRVVGIRVLFKKVIHPRRGRYPYRTVGDQRLLNLPRSCRHIALECSSIRKTFPASPGKKFRSFPAGKGFPTADNSVGRMRLLSIRQSKRQAEA